MSEQGLTKQGLIKLTNTFEKDLMKNIVEYMITAQNVVGWASDKKLAFALGKVNVYLGDEKYNLYKDLVIEIINTIKFIATNKDLRVQLQRLSSECGNMFGCNII